MIYNVDEVGKKVTEWVPGKADKAQILFGKQL